MSKFNNLKISDLKENNLKSISLDIPHDQITVVCGPSGSGKSTLAFDAIYAEGARRYVETFDPYTRQFLDRLKAPDLSAIECVRPSLALEQRNRVTSSRSTVGTVTEINDYLKVLWSDVSQLYCEQCGGAVKSYSPEMILEDVFENRKEIDFENSFFYLTFKIGISKASHDAVFQTLKSAGFSRIYDYKRRSVIKIDDLSPREIKAKTQEFCVVVDRISVSNLDAIKNDLKFRSRFFSSSSQCYEFGKKQLGLIIIEESLREHFLSYSQSLHCSTCNISYNKPSPSLFSYNSPIGACDECRGFGNVLRVDINKVIPDHSISIKEGAINSWNGELGKKQKSALMDFCKENNISLTTPWVNLSKSEKELIVNGPRIKHKNFKGIIPWFKLISEKRHKMHLRIFVAKHRSEFLCDSCNGSRLVNESLLYKIKNKNISQVNDLPIEDLLKWLEDVVVSEEMQVVKNEIISRVNYLIQVGLPYITLSRQTRSLSGGEFQRVSLTNLLGANLVNSSFVLDEPTIGLHSRDTKLLIKAMRDLSDRGNTIVVVEHDPEVIANADRVIELGPKSGEAGGEVVYQGPPTAILKAKTATAKYFEDRKSFPLTKQKRKVKEPRFLEIKNARANNLKELSLRIPLDSFVVLGGVSGSGKSTLLHQCLYEAYKQGGNQKSIKTTDCEILGLNLINEVVLIDQQPIGKSSRANPATYTKVWDDFRDYYSETEAASTLGLTKSSFSFNVDGGRCPVCRGNGFIKVEMQFLTDVEIECEACLGRRFQDQILAIRLGAKSVIELLNTPISEIPEYLKSLSNEKRNASIMKGIKPLIDLGLGYLKLGQSLSSLSGGEAQRLKLASYLASKSNNNLFILDEPTTGLHPSDISVLLDAISEIISSGNSVFCIEHNLDVIKDADWLIELGPEGGKAGGSLIAEGEPTALVVNKAKKTPTLISLREDLGLKGSKFLKKNNDRKEKQIIRIRGAREHNLKNINIDIPQNKLCVISGLSGSGKSTLAFDILFSEGQRRFIDCLSPYARQYISQESKPDVDLVEGLPPTVAVSQKIAPPSGVSTLATVTEVYQYLRLLFSKVGTQHCIHDGELISNFSQETLVQEIISKFKDKTIYIFSPVVMGRKGHYRELFERMLKAEVQYARVDSEYLKIPENYKLERHKLHWVSVEVAKVKASHGNINMLQHAVSQALIMSQGSIEICIDPYSAPEVFSLDRVCPKCKTGYLPLDPQDFSFRSYRGMCKTCLGTGKLNILGQRSFTDCPDCKGSRVGLIGRNVLISGKNIFELSSMNSSELFKFLSEWEYQKRLEPIVAPVLKELLSLLRMISDIGLDYLSLNRDAQTLSGGEAQRLRLAKNLGAPLTGVCYVLDEPSIGLHPSDHGRLMFTLKKIRDQGNTVIVVEHDEDTILDADHVIDVGPDAGITGGNVVFEGPVKGLLKSKNSKTAEGFSLKKDLVKEFESLKQKKLSEFISIEGVKTNNLKSVNVKIPINAITCISGVSGAGKSSLVYASIVPAIIEELEGVEEREKYYDKNWEKFSAPEELSKMIEIDQKPIGKTPASTPASFLGLFDEIRKLYATLPEAKIRGYNASHFSYNTGKGKCSNCEGRGYVKIPMSFLPDALSECEICMGLRYNEQTLEVKYRNYSIGDILKLTMSEAREVLSAHAKIKHILDYVVELGIGYLSLGQASHTLSGGEAQRLKIVREISSQNLNPRGEVSHCLYLLDEPTIGLHMLDVKKLISVLKKLVEKGNTVVVIEHNFDVLLSSDYVIDIGPGPGEAGGHILFQGNKDKFVSSKYLSPTKEEINRYFSNYRT